MYGICSKFEGIVAKVYDKRNIKLVVIHLEAEHTHPSVWKT